MLVELVGIVGTIFILLSFVKTGEKRIRQLNLVGSIIYVIYGILISSFSTTVLNIIMIIVHIYYLKKHE